mmetsp:Transcript_812/g.2996  ORF Transcript_812/g.2996 Transcript_812/m.2996 type:complete len:80 (+) Transcript_812:2350-2589(+)
MPLSLKYCSSGMCFGPPSSLSESASSSALLGLDPPLSWMREERFLATAAFGATGRRLRMLWRNAGLDADVEGSECIAAS